MKKETILHIPMSEYAHGLDERRIVLRLRAARGDLERVTLWYGDTACRKTPIDWFPEPMERVLSDEYHDWWELTLECPYHRIFYHFELSDGAESCYYYGGVFTDKLVDDRSEYFKLPFNHRADIARVPDWVHEAVVYNIFPDSFATSRRYISGEATQREFGGLTTHGKLGGTIRGVTENLDYLSGLGINCVYLNPIFAAGEYHKYDLIDYYHIDPCLGTDEDFRELVESAHGLGMRVIIDGVFNHCGWRFFAFEDVVQKGEASRYKDWFYRLEFPVVRPEDPEAIPGYECFGYERLMPKLDTANPEVREYFCSVGEHWVREYGIDGWRLDVASEVDDSFWRAMTWAAFSPYAAGTRGGTGWPCSSSSASRAYRASSTATSWAPPASWRPTTAAPCHGRAGMRNSWPSTAAPLPCAGSWRPCAAGISAAFRRSATAGSSPFPGNTAASACTWP